MNPKIINILKTILYVCFFGGLLYYSYLLLLITLQYVPINFEAAFLRVKQEEIQLLHYQIAFFTHVYTSIFVLFSGILQFIPQVRTRFPKLHKFSGYIYITTLLLLAAPSGLVMAFYANGGIYSQISFILLGSLWIIFTLTSFIYIKKGNWVQHHKFMIRSYALTLSAISLRLLKLAIVSIYELPPMDTYKIVAWLGWIINLLIAEIIILVIYRMKRLN